MKKVIITRPLETSRNWQQWFEEKHITPVYLPLFFNTSINESILKDQLENKKIDWIFFTSTIAVDIFFKSILPMKTKAKIAAIGNSTKRKIESYGLEVDFIPTESSFENLVSQIPCNKKIEFIFYPKSQLSKNKVEPFFTNALSLDTYSHRLIYYTQEQLEGLKNIKYIIFASGSSVRYYQKLIGVWKNLKIIAIGNTALLALNNINKIPFFTTNKIEEALDSVI